MSPNRSIVELEQSFDRALSMLEHLPWAALKLHIINALRQDIDQNIGKGQRTSFYQELVPYLVQATDPHQELTCQDPRLLDDLFSWLQQLTTASILTHHEFITFEHRFFPVLIEVYLRLHEYSALIRLLKQHKKLSKQKEFIQREENSQLGISPRIEAEHFCNLMFEYVDSKTRSILKTLSDPDSFESSGQTAAGLFVVGYNEFTTGLVGEISLESIRLQRSTGQDRLRFASHVVDADDILAQQAGDLLTNIRHLHGLPQNQHIHLSYSINQPPSLVVGNSIGFVLAILGNVALDNLLNNKSFQPVIYRDVAFTGAINANGDVLPIDERNIAAKMSAVFYGPYRAVVIPAANQLAADQALAKLQQDFPHRSIDIIPVAHITELQKKREVVYLQRRRVVDRVKQAVQRYNTVIGYSVVGVILLVLLFGYIYIIKSPVPARAILKDDRFEIQNRYGFALWESASLGVKVSRVSLENTVRIRDLDDDGVPEVIIGYPVTADRVVQGNVVCYISSGEILWKYHLGKPVHYGDNLYDDFFSIARLYLKDFNHDGNMEIVAYGNQTFFPNRIVLLSKRGIKISEYWHSGNIRDIIMGELYPDNQTEELVLAGVNNESDSGVLTILDPFRMNGASPQMKHYYTNQDYPLGNAIYYIRFPDTHFQSKRHRDTMGRLVINQNSKLQARLYGTVLRNEKGKYSADVVYGFGKDMGVEFLDLSDSYYIVYKKYYPDQPELPYNNPAILDHFRHLSYWDGSEWISTPTVTSQYRKTLQDTTLNLAKSDPATR